MKNIYKYFSFNKIKKVSFLNGFKFLSINTKTFAHKNEEEISFDFTNIKVQNRNSLSNNNKKEVSINNVINSEKSIEIINKEAQKYLDKLIKAINNLNDGNVLLEGVRDSEVKINILNKKIDKTDVGMYIIKYDSTINQMCLTSPISGFFRYNFDATSGFWVNEKDNHILDDIVIREFCKHSKDLLLFD